MKCDLCGSQRATVKTESDYIHYKMTTRQILWCPDCGYRRELKDCHTELDLNTKDKTAKEYAEEKKEAYDEIKKRDASRSRRKSNYMPSSPVAPSVKPGYSAPAPVYSQPTASGPQAKKAKGCSVGFFIVILVIYLLIRFFAELL